MKKTLIIVSFFLTAKFFAQTSAIGNYVWYDTNRNSIQDSTEIGISNVKVILIKPGGQKDSLLTDASGKYLFSNLAQGVYSMEFITPAGMVAANANIGQDDMDSDPIAGIVSNINLLNNTIDSTIDAGFTNACTGTVKGNVWHDIDGMTDGVIDSVGAYTTFNIPNALRVSLVSNATGLVVKTTFVNGLGIFTILNVPPGMYHLVLSTIPGTVGQIPPMPNLPTNWRFIGEKFGAGSGRDLQINGKLFIWVGYECVSDIRFGIRNNNPYVCSECVD